MPNTTSALDALASYVARKANARLARRGLVQAAEETRPSSPYGDYEDAVEALLTDIHWLRPIEFSRLWLVNLLCDDGLVVPLSGGRFELTISGQQVMFSGPSHTASRAAG